jgi:hypothetical protein
MWRLVTTSQILVFSFPEYIKLVKLAMVQIIGNVEDERCFSILAFMNSKLRNKLIIHLPIVVHMFAQQFYTFENLPYVECIEQWRASQHRYSFDG